MELTPRKQAVLKALVKAYIETGEPIGSKNLMLMLQNAPSSATLRHEMSELCELGFLNQPHTSAGRIPTSKGYRFYVENLDGEKDVNASFADSIENTLTSARCEAENIPDTVASLLSRLTGLPTFACLVTEKMPRIKRIELLPIGKFSKMLLVITDDGRTRNRIFRQGKDFSPEIENIFYNLIEKRVKGKSVDTLTKAYMQTVITEAGLYALDLMPLFTAVFETASEIEKAKIKLFGKEYLYNVSGETLAPKIQALIERCEPILSCLLDVEEKTQVVFGNETPYAELKDNNMIVSKFAGSDKYKGYIGVIGSARISYEQIIPCIEYSAKRLTEIMTEAQMDMED